MCVRVCVCVLPVLAEKSCEHVSSLQLLSQLYSHGHLGELGSLNTYEALDTVLLDGHTHTHTSMYTVHKYTHAQTLIYLHL